MTAGAGAHSATARLEPRLFPLSFAQERLWFVDAAAPGNATYNVPLLFHSHQPLDVVALARALEAVTTRHAPLRTVFRLAGGRPVQRVLEPRPVEVEVIDAAGAADAGDRVRAEAVARGRLPFDLAEGPLLRCTVWRGLPEGGNAVLLTIHHIAVDGWSLAPLFDDLAAAYEAALDGRDTALPALPAAYPDFAAHERATEDDPAFRQRVEDRAAELVGIPVGLELAGCAPRDAAPDGSRTGRQITRPVGEKVREGVARLARSLRVTPYVVLAAAFQTVLHRWSGRSEFLLATMTANRTHADLEQAVGFFVDTVPLRCRVDPEASFAELCAVARREAFRHLTHRSVPFDRLTAAATAALGQGRRPLVDIGFVYQNMSAPKSTRTRWTPPEVLHTGTAKFDLLLIVDEAEDGLALTVEYDTDRYPARTAEAVADGVAALLERVVEAPSAALRELPALPGQPSAGELPAPPAAALAAARSGSRTAQPGAARPAGGPEPTEAERRAAGLFAAALAGPGSALDPAGLPPDTNFFMLGGHSLLAVTMLADAQRRYGAALSPRDFLAEPTVAGLGRLLAAGTTGERRGAPSGAGRPPAAAVPDERQHPASPIQQRFWFLDRLPSLRAAYLIPTVVEYTGAVDRDALRGAVDAVLARHPSLRSRFFLDRRKRQVCYSTDGTPALTPVTDASDWNAARLREHLSRLCWAPMDLALGTLARAEIVIAGDRTLLVLVVHHIVADGWSRDLLMAEITEVYRAATTGREPELPDPVHPSLLTADDGPGDVDLAAQTAALLEHLRGAPVDVRLPHDRPRGELQTTDAGLCTTRLGGDVATGLRAVTGAALGCTMFMTSAALLAVTLARRGDQRDFLFAFPWAGRETSGSADAVGMLVNTLVLRVDLRHSTTWADLLAQVRESCVVSYRNAHVALDALAAELHPDRDLSRPALTPVYLAFQGSAPVPDELAPGVTGRHLPLDPLHLKYELELVVTEHGARDMELAFSYTTGLFGEDTVRELLAELAVAAADLVADPDSPPLKRSMS
ncbi:condensation domain-containing protein [Streptomyces sp. NPDC088812]|uniref:condensation domain-containing protein n=1 Tax=Streptomyces sp. NPDC088812 TaxID=3365905 RepID=UPI0038058B59